MPKKVEVTTNEARHDLGAMGIAFPLCDGGVGSGHGMAQSSIPSAKLGQRCSPPLLLSEHRNPIAIAMMYLVSALLTLASRFWILL